MKLLSECGDRPAASNSVEPARRLEMGYAIIVKIIHARQSKATVCLGNPLRKISVYSVREPVR
jgi:hypothetical protein